MEDNFEEKLDEILTFKLERGVKRPHLSSMFKEIGYFLDETYVQVQRLMTKNKLLFYSDDDEFLEDQELKEKIKIESRSA